MTARPTLPRVPVRALAVPLLLVLALLAPTTATSSAAAGDPAATARPRGSTQTTHTGQPGRPLRRVDVVDLNIERKASALATALSRAEHVGARLITLQEVCWWQVRDLRQEHPHWSVAWKPDTTSRPCLLDTEPIPLGERQRMASGNVAIWTGGDDAEVTTHPFRSQDSGRDQGMACLHWFKEVRVHLCSTHLLNTSKGRQRMRDIQFRQAREVRRITGRWIDKGGLVVVGGDFNAAKRTRTLDQMYLVDGLGRFQEATACPRDVLFCRRALSTTFDKGKIKIDYIFFSANRLPPGGPHLLRVRGTSSDHHMLSGWAQVRV